MALLEFEIATVFYGSELLSAALAFGIAYLMLRSFRVLRRDYLLGFPIGFSFLALSYLFFGMSQAFPSLEEFASWLSLFAGSYGFAFLASTYFLRKKSAVGASIGRLSHWLFSLLVVLAVAAFLIVVVPPFLLLPSYRAADEVIRIVNLGLVSYIVFSLYQVLKGEPNGVGTFVLVGFICLAFAQYSLLLWGLDQGFWSLALAHFLRLAGLIALAMTTFTRPHRS